MLGLQGFIFHADHEKVCRTVGYSYGEQSNQQNQDTNKRVILIIYASEFSS